MSDTHLTSDPAPTKPRPKLRAGLIVAVAAIVIAGVAYGLIRPSGTAVATNGSPCARTAEIVARVKPAIRGEVAALVPAASPLDLSHLSFRRADGSQTTLADWSGKVVLLNLWATWCAPCRAEMPALDRLQAQLGGKAFQVITINVDRASAGDKPQKFLSEIGVKSLAFQSDPTLGVFKVLQQASRSRGLPTTVLIDGNSCEIGTMYGSAGWDTPDGQQLVAAALGQT